jgi:hypothetical protein
LADKKRKHTKRQQQKIKAAEATQLNFEEISVEKPQLN